MRKANLLTLLVALTATASVQAVEGQFGNQCTMGLAAEQHVATDCSVNWVGQDGKTYCFGNEAAKAEFLKDAEGNLAKAQIFWSGRRGN